MSCGSSASRSMAAAIWAGGSSPTAHSRCTMRSRWPQCRRPGDDGWLRARSYQGTAGVAVTLAAAAFAALAVAAALADAAATTSAAAARAELDAGLALSGGPAIRC